MADQSPDNLFADLPTALPEELIEVLAENQHVRIERIVSTGHTSPEGYWYDQDEAEWVVVLKELIRQFNGSKDGYDDVNFTPPYLSKIKARALTIHGDRDASISVSIAFDIFQSIPNSHLWVIPNGSHWPIGDCHQADERMTAIGRRCHSALPRTTCPWGKHS